MSRNLRAHFGAGPQIERVCLGRLRQPFRLPQTLLDVKLPVERRGDPERDVRLDGEDIVEIALVTGGSYLGVGLGIDELHVDADAIIGIPNAADQDSADIQFGADLRGRSLLTLVGQHRTA